MIKFFYFIVSVLVGILAFFWNPFDSIDSYRYYQYTTSLSTDVTLTEFILVNFAQTFDFIYYLLFYFCLKLNIPVQIVTGLSIGLLFQQSFKFIDIICCRYNLKVKFTDEFLLKLFLVFSVSFVTLFGISRFVTGMVFFAFGINSLFSNRKLVANVFFMLAVFTHIGLLIYLILFYLGFKWNGKLLYNKIIRRVFLIFVVCIGLLSFLWISPVLKGLSLLWIVQSGYDYTRYFDVASSSNIFGFDLGFGDLLMFFTLFLTLTFELFFIRRCHRFTWVVFIIYTWLVISMGFSQMWVQRTILFLIPFQGALIATFFNDHKNSFTAYLFRGVLIVSILAFFINVYSYRGMWVFSWPAVK
jgi:hypothetical protein